MAMSTRAKWMAQCISDIFPSITEYEALVSAKTQGRPKGDPKGPSPTLTEFKINFLVFRSSSATPSTNSSSMGSSRAPDLLESSSTIKPPTR